MNKYAKYEPCCYSFLIVCLHFLARLKTRKTAFKDLYTYPYVEYSKLCTISTYPGRLSNICCNIFKAIQLPSLTVWDPDVEGIWKRVFASRQTQDQSMWKNSNLLTPRVWVSNHDWYALLVALEQEWSYLAFATSQKLAASLSWQEVIFSLSKMLKSMAFLYQSQ